MRGQVPQGYKQTEVGVIPEDWRQSMVGAEFEIKNNLRLPLSSSVRKSMTGDFPYYGPTGVQGYINEFRVEGDFALIGEDGDHFLKWNERPMTQMVGGRFNVNNHAHIVLGVNNETQWFYYYFYNRDITSFLTRQGANRYKLTKKTLLDLPCAIPASKKEQRAIAEALSDADALIDSLEQLVAKKRQIKQGVMQELLTGQRRLPGFGGEWIQRRLGDLANIKTGSRNNLEKVENGEFPFFVRSATVERINNYSYDCEAILVPGEGGIGSIFHYIFGKFDVHQRVYAITQFSKNISGNFVYYYMRTYFGPHAMENSVKATVDSLRLPTFLEFEINTPPSLKEQIEIAATLSEMEQELEVLEKRLKKAQTIKQAMMQELLTGRIRLI